MYKYSLFHFVNRNILFSAIVTRMNNMYYYYHYYQTYVPKHLTFCVFTLD